MEFKAQKKRVLPLILLIDTSGSMNSCIDELNIAVKDMIEELKKQQSLRADISVSIITFGGNEAELHLQLTPITQVKFKNFIANGMTPFGGALSIAKEIIENREIITSASYRPMVILLSDGAPNDLWEEPFKKFIEEGRSKKCERISLGIGNGYSPEILKKFSSNGDICRAQNAKNIVEFFKFMTMTVKEKTLSDNPNKSIGNLLESLLGNENEKESKKLINDRSETIDFEKFQEMLN